MGQSLRRTKLARFEDDVSKGRSSASSGSSEDLSERRGKYGQNGQIASEVLKRRLYLGNRLDGIEVRMKNKHKITHVLCLEQSSRYPAEESDLEYLAAPMEDSGSTDLSTFIPTVSKFIQDALSQPQNKLLIHCAQGINRGPTVVMWYLLQTQAMTYDEALNHINSVRDGVSLHPNYEMALREFAQNKRFEVHRNRGPISPQLESQEKIIQEKQASVKRYMSIKLDDIDTDGTRIVTDVQVEEEKNDSSKENCATENRRRSSALLRRMSDKSQKRTQSNPLDEPYSIVRAL